MLPNETHTVKPCDTDNRAISPEEQARFRELLRLLQKGICTQNVGIIIEINKCLRDECSNMLDRLASQVCETTNIELQRVSMPIVILLTVAEAYIFSRHTVKRLQLHHDLNDDVAQEAARKVIQRLESVEEQPLKWECYNDLQRYMRTVTDSVGTNVHNSESKHIHSTDDWQERATGIVMHRTPKRTIKITAEEECRFPLPYDPEHDR